MKNITVSVPDDVYRAARVRAAEADTSVSGLVADYLRKLAGDDAEFRRLERQQKEIQAGIRRFRGAGRLSRDQVHERAIR